MDPADLTSLVPLDGGWSGQTFLAEVGDTHSVVRIYAEPGPRGAAAHEVDAALLRLVRGLLPVPEVLEVRHADPATGLPALLVTSFLPGERGDVLLPRLRGAERATFARSVAGLVADLGGMPLLTPGPFVDGDLRTGSFWGPGEHVDGLPAYVDALVPRLGWWTPAELDGLREVAVDAQALLDTVTRVCLVHGGLNPKNLLVDTATLQVTGLVDWEFAHAGHPFTDLGNLLRLDRDETFTAAVLDTYAERRGVAPAEALPLARAADLWALVELATRRAANPVAGRADVLLREIARRRDPAAVPA
ncbi:MAG: phosphotransferase family protein [Nocardioides sp.]